MSFHYFFGGGYRILNRIFPNKFLQNVIFIFLNLQNTIVRDIEEFPSLQCPTFVRIMRDIRNNRIFFLFTYNAISQLYHIKFVAILGNKLLTHGFIIISGLSKTSKMFFVKSGNRTTNEKSTWIK